jgi:hypothetical protein
MRGYSATRQPRPGVGRFAGSNPCVSRFNSLYAGSRLAGIRRIGIEPVTDAEIGEEVSGAISQVRDIAKSRFCLRAEIQSGRVPSIGSTLTR